MDEIIDNLQIKQWILPAVTGKDREEINRKNIKLIGKAVWIFAAVAAALFLFFVAVYARSFKEHRTALLGMGCCVAMFAFMILISTRWKREPEAAAKDSTVVIIELLYWMFSIWGICLSLALYTRGHQMMILDTVQIGFALLVCTYPLWAILRTLIVYAVLLVFLYRVNGASQINVVNYCLMAGMICFGNVIRYGMELRNIQQLRALEKRARVLEDHSTHDALTGMKNRAALREDFSSFCGEYLWLIIADVDHFKKFNDTYGHDTGDRILQAVAGVIRTIFGEASTYRYGGDEFLIILKGCTRSEMTTMLMVWASEIRRIHLDDLPEEMSIRCSYGFTGGKPENEAQLRTMITAADEKLYEMKHSRVM